MLCYDFNDNINLKGSVKVPTKKDLYKHDILENFFVGQIVYVYDEKCNYVLMNKETNDKNLMHYTADWKKLEEYYPPDNSDYFTNNVKLDKDNKDNSELIKQYEIAKEEINNSFVISDQTKNLVISLITTELRILKGEIKEDCPWNQNMYNKIIY